MKDIEEALLRLGAITRTKLFGLGSGQRLLPLANIVRILFIDY